MPARNTDIHLPARTWVQITDANIAAIRVKEKFGFTVKLKATVGEVPPVNDLGSYDLRGYESIGGNISLSHIFGGVSGANRVYAYCDFATVLSVSHV